MEIIVKRKNKEKNLQNIENENYSIFHLQFFLLSDLYYKAPNTKKTILNIIHTSFVLFIMSKI